jgi:hypothetical protein
MDGYPANPTNPFSWQDELGRWTKTAGLQNYLQTGLQDSTIGKSGFFDQATAQAQALRAANIAQAQQAIGQAPVAGIDPAAAIAAGQQAQAQALAQRNAARQGGWQTAQGNLQSTTDWINKLLASTSQAVTKEQQEWQNYQQGIMTGSAQNQSGTNSMLGGLLGGAGSVGGSLLGQSGGGSNSGSKASSAGKFGSTASGALSGASTGAAFGPYGAAAGAILGGARGYFS